MGDGFDSDSLPEGLHQLFGALTAIFGGLGSVFDSLGLIARLLQLLYGGLRPYAYRSQRRLEICFFFL